MFIRVRVIVFTLFALLLCLARTDQPRAQAMFAPFMASSSSNNCGTGPLPSYATAIGVSTVAFCEQFTSTGNIDLAQTLPPGKNWYTTNTANAASGWAPGQCPGMPISPSWFSASGGVLTITSNSSTCRGNEVNSIGYVSGTTFVSGVNVTASSNGLYAEMYAQWEPPTSETDVPAFWIINKQLWMNQLSNGATGTGGGCEIDIFQGKSPTDTIQTVADWPSYTFGSATYDNSNAILTGTDYTQLHRWGALLTPRAKGGGTGSVCFYLDRVQTGSCITWTTSGQVGFDCEGATFVINFNSSVTPPGGFNIGSVLIAN